MTDVRRSSAARSTMGPPVGDAVRPAKVQRALVAAITASLIGVGSSAVAAPASTPPSSAHAAPAASSDTDPASRSVAARSRMLECGHQWSSMKKAGTATGTWREFSRGCLAQR